jgi:hypothetical protein
LVFKCFVEAGKKKHFCSGRFRSFDLWVMSPTRFLCATEQFDELLTLLKLTKYIKSFLKIYRTNACIQL